MKKEQDNIIDIATIIPIGHENAVSRKYLVTKTGLKDRAIRKAIEISDAPIINLGYGYFIPDENDPIDQSEAIAYCAQERARAQTIINKMMAKFGRYDNITA